MLHVVLLHNSIVFQEANVHLWKYCISWYINSRWGYITNTFQSLMKLKTVPHLPQAIECIIVWTVEALSVHNTIHLHQENRLPSYDDIWKGHSLAKQRRTVCHRLQWSWNYFSCYLCLKCCHRYACLICLFAKTITSVVFFKSMKCIYFWHRNSTAPWRQQRAHGHHFFGCHVGILGACPAAQY